MRDYGIIESMKHTTKILTGILIVIALILYTVYSAFISAPKKITVRRETLSSDKIPASMDGIEITFFSDLEYGLYVDEERLNTLISTINNTGSDIVIFGGDLFEETITPDEGMAATLTNALSSIDAPLGKFAVYGDNDKQNETIQATVDTILKNGSFELLNNTSIALRNRSNGSVTLVGLDNTINGTPDTTTAYQNVSHSNYVIAVSHVPSIVDQLPSDLTDYCLAGHTHGGQAWWFFNSLYAPQGAEKYLRGKEKTSSGIVLDITNGTGTTQTDLRFLSDAEIVCYTLESTETQSSE